MPPAVAPLSAMPRPSGVSAACSAPMTPAIAHSESSTAQSAKQTSSAMPAIVMRVETGEPGDRMSRVPPCGATSTMGAAGSQAVVSSIAAENPASTPNTLTGASPMIGTIARITVMTAVREAVPPGHPLGVQERRERGARRGDRAARADAARDQSGNHGGRHGDERGDAESDRCDGEPDAGDREPTGTGAELRDGEPGDRGREQCGVAIQLAVSTSAPSAACRRGDHVRREVDAEVAGRRRRRWRRRRATAAAREAGKVPGHGKAPDGEAHDAVREVGTRRRVRHPG